MLNFSVDIRMLPYKPNPLTEPDPSLYMENMRKRKPGSDELPKYEDEPFPNTDSTEVDEGQERRDTEGSDLYFPDTEINPKLENPDLNKWR